MAEERQAATVPIARWAFFKAAFWGTALVVILPVYGFVGLALLVRDELIQPKDAAQWKLPYLASRLPVLAWFAIAFVVTLAVVFEGAFRVYRAGITQRDSAIRNLQDRIAALETPDVRLEGTFPGTFALHARGHACEIRTGPIMIEAEIIGTETQGEQTMPVLYPRQTIEFPIVSDLRDGDKPVEPSLFSWEYDRTSWPEPGATTAMTQFLHAVQLVHRYRAAKSALGREDVELDSSKLSVAELEAIAERRHQPFELPFEVTYWNSDRTKQWKRSELLVYEPQTNTAFVRHVGGPVLSVAASIVVIA
jgi:hypothetical protein